MDELKKKKIKKALEQNQKNLEGENPMTVTFTLTTQGEKIAYTETAKSIIRTCMKTGILPSSDGIGSFAKKLSMGALTALVLNEEETAEAVRDYVPIAHAKVLEDLLKAVREANIGSNGDKKETIH